MASKKRGLIISRQIASAQAFKAWMNQSATKENFDLDVWFYKPSESLLTGKRIDTFSPPQGHYDFIFCGTSLEAKEDSQWFKWASENSIPSFAFVDQWINLAKRFDSEMHPDYIFVPDLAAQNALKQELNTKSRIIAAGSPALNYIPDFWSQHKKEVSQEKLIYFATEPTSREYSAEHGLSDLQQLDYLLEFAELDPNLKFLVKPHPSDTAARLKKYEYLISQETKEQVFQKASLVTGMRSMFLLEASLLSIPVLSLQIGRKTPSLLTDSRPNIKVVTDKKDISLEVPVTAPDLSICNDKWTANILKILN